MNLDSFAFWHLKPILNRCGDCKKAKTEHQQKSDHQYERDKSLPVWKGWHAFRRGNATYLAKQLTGNGARAASIMLRHSDQGVTEEHYILNTKQDRRALKAFQELEVSRERDGAADAIGQGLRRVN
jgi:integrase